MKYNKHTYKQTCPLASPFAGGQSEKEKTMKTNKIPPPLSKLAAVTTALVALLMAGSVGAQVTTNGLSAPGVNCGASNDIAIHLGSSSRTNTNLPLRMGTATQGWNAIRGLLGVGDNPVASIQVSLEVTNFQTGMVVDDSVVGTVTSSQMLPNTVNNITITPNTAYVVKAYTDFTGAGKDNPFAINCFISGGTYNGVKNSFVEDGFGGSLSGCFQLSGLDIRNCLCGRKDHNDEGTLVEGGGFEFTDSQRIRLGCANLSNS